MTTGTNKDIFVSDEELEESTQIPNETEQTDPRLVFNSVDLPSNGKLGYPTSVEYRDILVKDEKNLSTATEDTYSKTLNKVLKSVLNNPEWYNDLCIHDRDFLLMWIWANNYNTVQQLNITCPDCGHKEKIDIDLTKLNVDNISSDFTNPFNLKMRNGEVVKLELATVKTEQIATEFMRKKNKKNMYDLSLVMIALCATFPTIMPLEQKLKYIENNVTGHDMGHIRAFFEYFKYGVDNTKDHECSSCGEVATIEIPFRADFLMPTLSDNFEKMLHNGKGT